MDINNDLRGYLDILEFYSMDSAPVTMLVEAAQPVPVDVTDKLSDILFKLRSYSDATGGEYSLGFEQGLEMASTMIENLINNMGENSGS